MDLIEQAQRARVVEIAKTWIRTPYAHAGMVRGQGVDCATLIFAVFREAGLIGDITLPPYSGQWHVHRDEEKYTDFIRQFATEVTDRTPLPGDVVCFKFHRCFAHGAIVVDFGRPSSTPSSMSAALRTAPSKTRCWRRSASACRRRASPGR
jgi:cell wall-associated NlpC family hydrolase